MNEKPFDALSPEQQAEVVLSEGRLLEAEDFYSFFVLSYLFNHHYFKLLYDFSGMLVSIEREESTLSSSR